MHTIVSCFPLSPVVVVTAILPGPESLLHTIFSHSYTLGSAVCAHLPGAPHASLTYGV